MQNLLNAAETYATTYANWEAANPFDLTTIMDRTPAPVQSPEARAGELIAAGGIVSAMRHMLLIAADRPLSDFDQQVATLLAIASVDDGE